RLLWCTTASPIPSAPSSVRCPAAALAKRTRESCRGHSDGRGERPGRPKRSSRGRRVQASHTPQARRKRDRRSADGDRRTGRVDSPCPWAHRTRTPFPPPPTASADARRPAHHGRGSAPSPSRAVAVAPHPTAPPTQSGASSFSKFLSLSNDLFRSTPYLILHS